jgi:hypothetical protein
VRREFPFAFDQATAAQAFAAPGGDTRMWLSMGLVLPDSETVKSADFDYLKDIGSPLVAVKLQPAGTEVPCRVAMSVCGNGEAEWHPFVEGDEVVVAIFGGDERAGCVILGRVNNLFDAYPTQVAGNDTTLNTLSFRRSRAPIVFESAASVLLRASTTGSFLSLDDTGAIYMANGDKALFQLGHDVVGFRLNDGVSGIEFDPSDGSLSIRSNDDTQLLVGGSLRLSASGANPWRHAITLEQVLVVLQGVLTAQGLVHGPFAAPWATALLASINTGVLTAATLPITPFQASIQTALEAPDDPLAVKPGVGSAGILLG